MNRKFISTIVLVMFVAFAAGCGTIPEKHKGAAVGAGAGAATGAAAGAIIGKSTSAAVIGGLVGALVGGAIGHYAYDQQRSAKETAQTYNYNDAQGTVLAIENAAASPKSVRPGGTVDIEMTYAVLNPQGSISITEIREITHNGRLVGKPEVTVQRSAGTYTSRVPIRLPEGAERGWYEVKTMVQAQNARDTQITSFTVQ